MANTDKIRLRNLHPWLTGLAAVLGVILTGAVCLVVQMRGEGRSFDRFDSAVQDARGGMQARMDLLLKRIQTLADFFQESHGVERAEFEVHGANDPGSPWVEALMWVPLVQGDERGAFETGLQAEKTVQSVVFELDASGHPIPALTREEYYPVARMCGTLGEIAPGMDLHTQPVFEAVLKECCLTRRVALRTFQGDSVSGGVERRMVLAVPVFWDLPDENLEVSAPGRFRGCLVSVCKLGSYLAGPGVDARLTGLDFLVLDETAPPQNRFQYYHSSTLHPSSAALSTELAFRSGLHREEHVQLGAHRWTVLFRPGKSPHRPMSLSGLVVLLVGLISTVLGTFYVHTTTRRAATVQEVVVERTVALRKAQQRLEAELRRQQETESQLRESERILKRAHEIAGLAVWKWDWATDSLVLPDELLGLYGQPREVLDGTMEQFFQWSPPEDRERLALYKAQARSGKALPPFEFRITLPSGAERFIRAVVDFSMDAHGQPNGIIGSFQDITPSKLLEDALRRQREEYSMIFNLAPAIILFNDIEGRIVRANNAAALAFGCPVTQLEGRTLAEVGVQSGEIFEAANREVIKSGQPQFGVLVPIQNAHGQPRWLDTNKVPYREPNGRIKGVVTLAQDITQRRDAEDGLKQRNVERSILYTIVTALNNSLEVSQVLATLKTQMIARLGVTAGAIATFHPEWPDALQLDFAWGLSPEAVVAMRERLRVTPVPDSPTELDGEDLVQDGPGRARQWHIPLLAQGESVGMAWLICCHPKQRFELGRSFFRALGLAAGVSLRHARLFQEITVGRERLRDLSRQVIAVQETERENLARELHDQIGQQLTALKMAVDFSGVTSDSRAGQILNDLIQRVRQLSLDLRPPMLDDLGLVPAVLWLVEQYSTMPGLVIRLEQLGVERRFPGVLETAAFRIVQEALTNAVRHARSDTITVRLWADDLELAVQVEDAGVGFDPEAVLRTPRSSGLAGMRERVRLLGGELTLESTPGRGTRLIVELPLPASGLNPES